MFSLSTSSSDEGGWKTINKKKREKKEKIIIKSKQDMKKKQFMETPPLVLAKSSTTKSGRMVQRASFDNTCTVRECKNVAMDKTAKCAASYCRRYLLFYLSIIFFPLFKIGCMLKDCLLHPLE